MVLIDPIVRISTVYRRWEVALDRWVYFVAEEVAAVIFILALVHQMSRIEVPCEFIVVHFGNRVVGNGKAELLLDHFAQLHYGLGSSDQDTC